jgi:hypothetical protein
MLKDCTNSIGEEIQRGFSVIRQMNRFSHSIDNPVESVNLMDIVDLAIKLSTYLSFAGKADVPPHEGPTPMVTTCPFLLQSIVYQTLVYTFKQMGTDGQVTVSIKGRGLDKGWRIFFSGFSVAGFQVFPDASLEAMAESIGVSINCDRTADWLELVVPSAIDG